MKLNHLMKSLYKRPCLRRPLIINLQGKFSLKQLVEMSIATATSGSIIALPSQLPKCNRDHLLELPSINSPAERFFFCLNTKWHRMNKSI